MKREAVLSSRDGIPVGYKRIRRGTCVDVGEWASAFVERRILLRAEAVSHSARVPPVWAFTTAAAFLDLPLLGVWSTNVHTIERSLNPQKTRRDVVRHNVPLPEADIAEHGAHLVTTLERTVYDAGRMLSIDGAVTLVDAAMRRIAWNPETRVYSPSKAEEFRAALMKRVRVNAGARGMKTLRFAVEFADGRSESPGESQSRLRMWELHIPPPELQLPITVDDVTRRADFGWPKFRRFGEFDGGIKLVDPAMANGLLPDDVLRAQAKRREDIERVTGWTVLHWGSADTKSAESFLAMLTAQGWPAYARG